MDTVIQNFKNYLTQFISVDNDAFKQADDYFQVDKISKGDHLVKEGQICNRVIYVDKGLFRIYTLKDGIEINSCFCMENSIVSSFNSLINQIPSNESIQAIEDSVVVSLSAVNLLKLQMDSVFWNTVSRIFTEKECFRLSNRAISLSFESATAKYKNILMHQPEIVQRVSIQHIASYIGVSRETLSRIRSQI
jgi:CRP-like cAMP-binding protein